MSLDWKRIARDTALVFVLGVLGGIVLGVAGFRTNDPSAIPALSAMNFAAGVLGFTIVGVCTPQKRWRHLVLVAGALWLVNLLGIPLRGGTLEDWAFGLGGIAINVVIGGGLSCLLAPSSPNKIPVK